MTVIERVATFGNDTIATDAMSSTIEVETTCPYCGVGCGVAAGRQGDAVVPVKGAGGHPANFGRLCVKGSALHETVGLEGRLLHPVLGGERVGWDDALGAMADKLRRVVDRHGPEAVAVYGAGQLLTEDYYVANKLMKGFIGSANMDTNSRLCMASAVASYKRAFGSDTVPGCYEDLERADLLVLTGSNAAWAHPILFQRMSAAKQANPDLKIVVIDPRRTATCEIADLHLPIRPGSDAFLFNALLAYLVKNQALDNDFIVKHTENFEVALECARQHSDSLANLARRLDVAETDLTRFFRWFAATERTVTFYSQGINQSASGTDKANAIINVHLATGRIGKPGAAPFSITGQPNAMGGREVGGLANQLAAHMDFTEADCDRVRRFWDAPAIAKRPGLKAVDLFKAVAAGRIKFLWIMSTNPLVSMPDADAVKAALERCEFVVVSDCMADTDTTAAADLLLPATGWGEKNGTVTNSERRISRQRNFLPAPGEARPDWWIVCQLAKRLGFGEAFAFQHPAEIFDEHARLSAFENDGSRDFDLSGLVGMSRDGYDRLQPVQWPVNADYPRGRARFFDDNRYYTPSGKARFVAVRPQLPAPRDGGDLIMNTGRVRDHWHTMTRTGKSPRLAQHISEPYADIHPGDALPRHIRDGGLVRITSPRASILVRAKLNEHQRRGDIFVPMHWTSQYASAARMGALIDSSNDPISGQPELKYTAVSAAPFIHRWQGFILSRRELDSLPCAYWASGTTAAGRFYELAGDQPAGEFIEQLQSRLPARDWLALSDPAREHYRRALIVDGRLECIIFVHAEHQLASRQWLLDRFNDDAISPTDRQSLLLGQPAGKPTDAPDKGAIICSCFQVGENQIKAAITQGCSTPEALGQHLLCGTNCGSCIPELKALLSG